ncbi:hypothetical protein BC936DRAFT_149634 [Jimgerdemannia flammicorona]|uniref:Cytoplasmic tRNA 2-thiolation protein 2 n=1 Tax=Jimgerdemannia flammicorona TaxID=994334 RepID=A0A433DK44_9FUNG|nr:hypothetical protein BC936DRAFT_149634 [Jimgerdemannia flammicorona]
MCDVDDPVMVAGPKPTQKTCIKCKTSPSVVVVRHATYCKSCFLFTFVGKFRTIIMKSKVVSQKEGERVLLAFSGGPSSRAMLHLLSDFQYIVPHETSKRQLFSGVTICHIDESALFGQEEQGTLARIEAIVRGQYPDLPFVGVRMEDVFGPNYTDSGAFDRVVEAVGGPVGADEFPIRLTPLNAVSPSPDLTPSNATRLTALFDSLTTGTAKEDLYSHLKLTILIHVARREGCTRLFLGDTSTRLAIKTISLTAKGRGYSLPLDVATEDAVSVPGMIVLRPMKDMLSKEVGVYNRFRGLEASVVVAKNFATGVGGRGSIERLTEGGFTGEGWNGMKTGHVQPRSLLVTWLSLPTAEFIVGLDRDFPSTVSTITRTASKLTHAESMNLEQACALCLKPIQLSTKEWRHRITVVTVPSSSTSSPPRSAALPIEPRMTPDLTDHFCYGCQVGLRDMRRVECTGAAFPPYVAERVATREERVEGLRKQIEGFLLEDEDNGKGER